MPHADRRRIEMDQLGPALRDDAQQGRLQVVFVGQPRGWFVGDLGRIRTVTVTPRGTLWITTSNRDGRGDPAPEDDRILEVALS